MDGNVKVAVVRPPGRSFARALTTRPDRAAIDPERAADQHAAYRAALAGLVDVVALDADEELPDACFVEDCAVVAGGWALLTRPGARSRAAEPERLAAALEPLVVGVARMTAPGTLDGGDVLRLGRTLVVGRSARTNLEGVAQLAGFAHAAGLDVALAAVPAGALHLQTAVTALADDTVVGSAWALGQPPFRSVAHRVVVPPEEAPARNLLALGSAVLAPAGCPRTAAAVARLGFDVHEVDLSEFHKADGGPTCLSLLV